MLEQIERDIKAALLNYKTPDIAGFSSHRALKESDARAAFPDKP